MPDDLDADRPQGSPGWSRAVADVVNVLRSPLGTPTRPSSIADLTTAAVFHGVEGAVRRAVGPGYERLDRAVHAVSARQMRVGTDLVAVRHTLEGIAPFLVVKGPALAATCYRRSEERSYVDLDVLVRPRDVAVTLASLRRQGFALLDANWPMLEKADVRELRVATPSGGALDLHWSLGPGPREARGAPPARTLIERSVGIDIGGQRFRTLNPADALVHVAVHAAASGGHRLVWYTDLRGAIDHARAQGRLDVVPSVTDEWRGRPAMAVMLLRASRTLGFPIPSPLQELTRPGLWTGLSRLVDRARPPELAGTGRSASRLFARAAGPSTAPSLQAVVAKAWQARRLSRHKLTHTAATLDPENPASAQFPIGGPAAEAAFLERVASEDG